MIEQELKPPLISHDPLKIEYLWRLMSGRTRQHGRRGIIMHAMSGIGIALWDIARKAAGMPLCRLFGAFTDQVEVYASGGFCQRGKNLGGLT